ncbi:ABC transporter permease [Gracilibacillus caseinilyticus]|uniref:ABC transporter permease n=1 Tax=Gracilibacillus caseinilyticus TaxID=2932256 RepID=A0ABY4EQS2_9BACI|nr:ABC transporter permease [Gracilibacillus caseinilyticus]UOQ46795.1 ABC transporter permease [Gracilibacillus caseinilyticus]
MNKFWTVFGHTYISKVKSKSFLITTAIFLVFIIAFSNIQSIMEMFNSEDTDHIAVVSEQAELVDVLSERLEADVELESFDGTLEEAKEAVTNEDYTAALAIDETKGGLPSATYYSTDYSNQSLQSSLENQLQQIKVEMATNQSGIDPTVISSIYEPVQFENELIATGDGSTENVKTEEELSGARGLVYVILFLLYFAVISYGNMIAMDIANEKTSRVMEILISSSSPVSQMFAKILGIGLVGLTQIVAFLAVGYIMITQKQDQFAGEFFETFGLSDINIATFVYAIVFFLLGYFLYATLSAMLGSLVSRTEDVQQLMMPVILLIVAAFMISMFGLSSPDSTLVVVSSYIPFFSPMAMFLRVGLLDIAMWEVGLSILILIASIIIFAVIGAKIYRGGVLMYGSSASLKDFKKALQLSKKD